MVCPTGIYILLLLLTLPACGGEADVLQPEGDLPSAVLVPLSDMASSTYLGFRGREH